MKKNVQRINESQLRAIVTESVKKVLNEMRYDGVGGESSYDETDINPDRSFLHMGDNDFANREEITADKKRYFENEYQLCAKLSDALNNKLHSMISALGMNRVDYDEETQTRLQKARNYVFQALTELDC